MRRTIMALILDLEPEIEQGFLAEPESVRNVAIKNFVKEFVDKQQRQRKREERLKNLSPITKEFAGIITQQDVDSISDNRFHYLLDR